MANKFSVWAPNMNYKGSFGKAERQTILDPFAPSHEVQIFETKQEFASSTPKDELKGLGLSKNQINAMQQDASNPAEVLPPDQTSIKLANTIPDFSPMMRDLMLPQDYELANQVSLVQQSRVNYIKQENEFDDPSNFGNPALHDGSSFDKTTERGGKPQQNFPNTVTGYQANFLTEEDASYNSITSEVAF